MDRRVRRTRDRLGDALVELLQEKPFEAIRIQDVLERAGVGRSTFYVHFRDKDDLFLSDVDQFFEAMSMLLVRRGESSERVAPVREFFAHVGEVHQFYKALLESGRIQDVLDLGRAHFARAIELKLAGLPRETRAAMAQACAGALLSMLTWWVDAGMPITPARADEIFHQLVWSGAVHSPHNRRGREVAGRV